MIARLRRVCRFGRWACSCAIALARDLRDASRTCVDCGCVIDRGACRCTEGV